MLQGRPSARRVRAFASAGFAALLLAGCTAGAPSRVAAPAVLRHVAPDGHAGDYRLARSADELVLSERGRVLARAPLAGLAGVQLRAADGVDDRLTLDFAGGAFALPQGVEYDGGTAGFDTLAVLAPGAAAQHRGFSPHDGEVLLPGLQVRYANLEPVVLTALATVTVTGTDAADTIAVSNGSGDRVRIEVAGQESVEIDDVTNLVIRGGNTVADVGDVINLDFSNVSTGLQTLTVDGDDAAASASGADRIEIDQVPAALVTTLRGGGGNDTFAFAAAATINGTLDGQAGTDTLDYSAYLTQVAVNLGASTNLAAALSGSEEVGPNGSNATGTATLTYDPLAKNFDVSVAVSGIAAPTGFHIHRGATGVNGPVVLDFGVAVTPDGSGGFTFTATDLALPLTLTEAQLLGGLSYVNVHTAAFPGGEIRGQLMPSANFSSVAGTATGTSGIANIESAIGGAVNDSLVGNSQGNVLAGRAGNDTLLGAQGADTLAGEGGDDALVWNNGDGSDVMEGGSELDTVHVNGSSAAESYSVADAAARVDFDRLSPGPFSLDIGSTESLGLNGLGGDDSYAFGTLANLTGTLRGSGFAGNDRWDLDGAAYADLRLQGGLGSDSVSGPDQAASWNLAAPTSSSSLAGVIAGMQLIENLTGGSASDSFVFGVNAAVGGVIDGGGGSDTLDYTTHGVSVAVNLGTGATGLAATLAADQEAPPTASAAGGAATASYDPLTRTLDLALVVSGLAPAAVNGFHIHRAAPGDNGSIIIDLGGCALLPAGDGFTCDLLDVPVPVQHEGALLGGLTYLNLHTPDLPGGAIRGQLFSTGNLAIGGTASGTGGVANVEHATGSALPDSLVGSFAANTLRGGAGNDVLLPGPGADVAQGEGSADQIAWNNGDGSDVVEGGSEADLLQVNGSSGNDVFLHAPNGARLDFDRTAPGPFSLDVGTVEQVVVAGLAGDDQFGVLGLAGILDLAALSFHGFDGADQFDFVANSAAAVTVAATGHAGSDSVLGPDIAGTWRINGDDASSLDGLFAQLYSVEVFSGGAAADDFLVIASPTRAFTVLGGDPAAAPGDGLAYDAQARPTSGDLTPPDGNIQSPGVADVSFFGIETFAVENPPRIFADGFE
jgi:hypothetical protein